MRATLGVLQKTIISFPPAAGHAGVRVGAAAAHALPAVPLQRRRVPRPAVRHRREGPAVQRVPGHGHVLRRRVSLSRCCQRFLLFNFKFN